jgi:hypothetical protein
MFEFAQKSTGNVLIAAIVFTILFFGTLYARQVKIGFIFFLLTALLWTIFTEEVRLEQCNARCPKK